MICRFCGNELNTNSVVCPYCNGQNLTENWTLNDAFRWIVDKYGIDIFLNNSLINSLLADLVKKDEQERKQIKLALSSGAGYQFYAIVTRVNGNISESEIMQFTKSLIDTGFSIEFSELITSIFLYSASLDDLTEIHYKQIKREFNELKSKRLDIGNIDSIKALKQRFEKFGNYKKTEEYISACDVLLKEIEYQDAIAFSEKCKNSSDLSSDLSILLAKFNALGDYRKAKEYAAAVQKAIDALKEKETAKQNNVKRSSASNKQDSHKKETSSNAGKKPSSNTLGPIGEYVQFGKNGWRVIAQQGEYVLLLSSQNVNKMAFYTGTVAGTRYRPEDMWYKTAICSWLNTLFNIDTFSDKEKEIIANVDLKAQFSKPGGNNSSKVFILNKAEAYKYFENDSERRIKHSGSWLRSYTSKDYNVAIISETGYIYDWGHNPTWQNGVRPAIWVKTNSLFEQLHGKETGKSVVDVNRWEIGKRVSFGKYSWLVLDKKENEVLILCTNNRRIPNEKFAFKLWYLNNDFINMFSVDERSLICYKQHLEPELGENARIGRKCFLLNHYEYTKYHYLIQQVSDYTNRPAIWVKMDIKENSIEPSVDKGSSSIDENGVGKLLFNGVYQYKNPEYSHFRYLRFFADGKVVGVSSDGTPEKVAQWLDHEYEDQGVYTVKNDVVKFVLTSSYGKVSYIGKIVNEAIDIDVVSNINGYRASGLRYIFCDLQQAKPATAPDEVAINTQKKSDGFSNNADRRNTPHLKGLRIFNKLNLHTKE